MIGFQTNMFSLITPNCVFRIKRGCDCQGKCDKYIDDNELEGIKIRRKYGINLSDKEKQELRKKYKLKW